MGDVSAKSMGVALRSWPSPLRGLRSRRPPSAHRVHRVHRVRGGVHAHCVAGPRHSHPVRRRSRWPVLLRVRRWHRRSAPHCCGFRRRGGHGHCGLHAPHRCGFHLRGGGRHRGGARPSVPRSLRAATAFAGAACGVDGCLRGRGRAHHRGRHPVRHVGHVLHRLGHHGGHRRAHCLQPGLLAQGLPRGWSRCRAKAEQALEPGEEALSCGTGAGAGAGCRGCRSGRGGSRPLRAPVAAAIARRAGCAFRAGLGHGAGASGSTPLMTGVCLLVGSCERRVTAVGSSTFFGQLVAGFDVVQTRIVVLQALQLVVAAFPASCWAPSARSRAA